MCAGNALFALSVAVHAQTLLRPASERGVDQTISKQILPSSGLSISLLNQGSDLINIRRSNQADARILVQTGDKIFLR